MGKEFCAVERDLNWFEWQQGVEAERSAAEERREAEVKEAFIKAGYKRAVICPYCKSDAQLVDGCTIYPHRKDLKNLRFWQCKPCDAYVGCHKDSDCVPLGRLANLELRKAKIAAHNEFDFVWKTGSMTRSNAYRRLAKDLGIDARECHIGMFDIDMCKRVQEIVREWF